MKPRARVVVIGGGVGGCSILYWLTRLGWQDVVLVERAELTSGSTFHSAGLVGQLRGSLSLTRMMMSSVELYRTLGDEVGLETGWREVGSLRLASSPERMEELARQSGWAKTFGLPLELISARGGAAALPADDDRRRPRRRLPADRRLHRPLAAHVRARRGRAPRRRRDLPAHAGDGDPGRARPRDRRRHRPGRDRGRGRRQRGRHVREGDRRARRRQRPDRADGARVPDHEAVGPADRHADDARPVAARLLPARVGRPDHGRLRARPGAVVARRDPGGLQRQAARRGLAAVRGADGERARPRPLARRAGGDQADQRARGVHAGRRVHPRADRGARPLDGGRLLRARARGRGRARAARRRVDRRGHAVARRLAHGLAPLRARLPLAGLHARPHARGLRDLLRREVPGPRAAGRAAAAALADLPAARRARRGLRREVGLGAGELVRAERRPRRRVAAAARLGGTALVARDRRRAPRLPRDGGALRRDLVRQDRDLRRGRAGAPRAALRQPRRARRRRDHLHVDAEPPRRDRVRLHGHPARRGALPDRHRHGVRPARPRLDPRARARRA